MDAEHTLAILHGLLMPIATGAALVGLVMGLAGIIRTVTLPPHERMASRYRFPKVEREELRRAVATEMTWDYVALMRWKATSKRVQAIAQDVIRCAKKVEASYRQTGDGVVGEATVGVFGKVIADMFTAMWIPEECEEKRRLMEEYEQRLWKLERGDGETRKTGAGA